MARPVLHCDIYCRSSCLFHPHYHQHRHYHQSSSNHQQSVYRPSSLRKTKAKTSLLSRGAARNPFCERGALHQINKRNNKQQPTERHTYNKHLSLDQQSEQQTKSNTETKTQLTYMFDFQRNESVKALNRTVRVCHSLPNVLYIKLQNFHCNCYNKILVFHVFSGKPKSTSF